MNTILSFSSVALSFGQQTVFKDFDLHLATGERMVVMGASGRGKTSLLRLAVGLLSPTAGHVVNTAKQTAVQFQEPRLLPNLTALENINVVLSDNQSSLAMARQMLDRVELSHAADLLPAELSGGMAQRVALARALAFGGDLYILDEPFRGLDPALRDRMIELVLERTQGASLLLITHDMEVAKRFSPTPVVLSDR